MLVYKIRVLILVFIKQEKENKQIMDKEKTNDLVVLFTNNMRKESYYAAIVVKTEEGSINTMNFIDSIIDIGHNFFDYYTQIALNYSFSNKGFIHEEHKYYNAFERQYLSLANISNKITEKSAEILKEMFSEEEIKSKETNTYTLSFVHEEILEIIENCKYYAKICIGLDRNCYERCFVDLGNTIKVIEAPKEELFNFYGEWIPKRTFEGNQKIKEDRVIFDEEGRYIKTNLLLSQCRNILDTIYNPERWSGWNGCHPPKHYFYNYAKRKYYRLDEI